MKDNKSPIFAPRGAKVSSAVWATLEVFAVPEERSKQGKLKIDSKCWNKKHLSECGGLCVFSF